MKTQELICEQYWHENGQLWCEIYWLNAKRHNEAGPAYLSWYDDGQKQTEQYWLHGDWLTKEEWQRRLPQCSPQRKTVVIDGVTYRLERV